MARPSKYDELDIRSKLDSIRGWALEGSTDEEIAKMLGVGKSSLYEWKKKFPEFLEAIKKGREVSNGELINSAVKTALGHNVIEQTAIKLKRVVFENGKKVAEEEYVEVIDLVKPIPSNPTMLIFMLKNRLPDKYRDRIVSPNGSPDEEKGNVSDLLDSLRKAAKDHGVG